METHGEFLADKMMDAANYGVAALIFGEMASREPLRWKPIVFGVVFFLGCAIFSLALRKRKERGKEDN